ncbi:glycine betaine ABC transporter substrate-binding protein [Virgibacillus sp. L01]|uniref:glycine betaine ABC transporter substrate-binding protein n=1 Tax=Virgibacillus sp. L01 TaxID=3457429 RepID=UPI003FD12D0B
MKKTIYLLLSLVLLAGILSACGNSEASGNEEKKITIGSKNFTEQYLLSKITALYLEKNGFEVEEVSDLGSSALRKALVNEQVDFVWEYTGTALVNYLGKDPIAKAQESYEAVKKADKENNITWMNMSEVNNTYAIAMEKTDTKKLGIKSLSDLANYVNNNPGELTFASAPEFASREDGLVGLQKVYDFKFGSGNAPTMQYGLQYEAINKQELDVVEVFSTDARVKEFDLTILEDDKQFFPAYYAAVAARDEIVEEYPELKTLTAELAEVLTSEVMTDLNYQVEIEGKMVEEVAKNWLDNSGLLSK